MRVPIAIASALTLTLSPASAQTRKPSPAAGTAKTYIDAIYREYERTGKQPDRRVFAPELAALIVRDGVLAEKQGEPNLLDFGLLCNCQDDEGMRFATSVVSTSASAAVIRVNTAYKASPAKQQSSFNLRLTRTVAGWRVADIITFGQYGGSLVARLKKGLGVTASAASLKSAPQLAFATMPPMQPSTAG